MKYKSIEDEINDFLKVLEEENTLDLLHQMFHVYDLYDVDADNDWVRECVGEDNLHNVRLIRTAYLLSKIADLHAGRLALIKIKFGGLWKRLEDIK